MDYRQLASQMAQRFGVDPNLYARLITQESNWNPQAVSPVGARGIAQIMPATALSPGFGVRPVQMGNVEDELRFGAEYLRAMMDYFDGDTTRALAAYNWGAGNVQRWNGDLNSLPEETRNYVKKVGGIGKSPVRMSTKGQPEMGTPSRQTKSNQLRTSVPALQSSPQSFMEMPEDTVISDGSKQAELIQQAQRMSRSDDRRRRTRGQAEPFIDLFPPRSPSNSQSQARGGPERGRGSVTVSGNPEVRGSRYREPDVVPPPVVPVADALSMAGQFQGPPSEDPRIIAGDALNAIGRAQQGPPMPPQAIPEPMQSPVVPPEVMPSSGVAAPPALQGPTEEAPMDQSNEQGFLSWLMPNMSDADRRQNLLAIGAGLLSGEDWSQGLALAGQGLAKAGEARLDRDRRMQEMLLQGELDSRLIQERAASQGPERLVPVGNIQDMNGNFIPNVWADPYTGQQFSVAADGTRTPVLGFDVNNSTYAGTDQQRVVTATVDRLRSARTSLGVIDNALSNIDDVKQGVPGLIQTAQIHLQTFLNSTNLTEEQINARLAQGDIQGLVGQIREQVVGPGVMTEQDAMRVLAYIGSDLRSFGGNRAVAEERLKQLRSRFERAFREDWSLYEQARQKFGNTLLIPEIEPIQFGSTGALDSSNAGQSLPVPQGVDPELWKQLTPEEQREFIGG